MDDVDNTLCEQVLKNVNCDVDQYCEKNHQEGKGNHLGDHP